MNKLGPLNPERFILKPLFQYAPRSVPGQIQATLSCLALLVCFAPLYPQVAMGTLGCFLIMGRHTQTARMEHERLHTLTWGACVRIAF